MKIILSTKDLAGLRWVQWRNRAGIVKAHAVDPASEERTGKLRTISGSIVPSDAVAADNDTPRDEFSLQLVEKAHKAWKAKRERTDKSVQSPDSDIATKEGINGPFVSLEAKVGTEATQSPELKYEGSEAQIWFGEHLLAVFEKARVNTKARHNIRLTDKTFRVYEGGKIVASGKLLK